MDRISYLLSLPPAPLEKVINRLALLRQYCLDLPFLDVTDIRIDPNPPRHTSMVFPGLKPLEATGFRCILGKEKTRDLTFFLYHYPRYKGIDIPWVHQSDCWATDDQHMIRHIAACKALEHAGSLGFGTDVRDCSGYWKFKDRKAAEAIRKQLAGVRIAGARKLPNTILTR